MIQNQNKSPMMQQIYSVPELMRQMEEPLHKEARRVAESLSRLPHRFDKVYITGCGDSYCAAMAAKYAFMEYTGMDAEAVPVIELSRYYRRDRLAKDTLVIIVSNSGTVARCIELAMRVRDAGGTVLAVTGNEQGGLYLNSQEAIKLSIPKFIYAPGIRSYCGCLASLFLFAVELGLARGEIAVSRAEQAISGLKKLPGSIEGCLPLWDQKALALAEAWQGMTGFELIGSGPSYACAAFGCAKALETTGRPAFAQNTEDWFHMNFFVKDVTKTGTILLSGESMGDAGRAKELHRVALDMGRPLIWVGDEFSEEGDCIRLPKTDEYTLDPLVQYLPVSMLFSHLGDRLGEAYFRDGKGRFHACVDCATLIQSEIVVK